MKGNHEGSVGISVEACAPESVRKTYGREEEE